MAAVSHQHPLRERASLSLDELAAYRLTCLPRRGTGIRAILEAGGVCARIAFGASDPGVLAQLGLRGRIALAWRAGGPSSTAARALVSHARSSVS